MLKYLLVQFLFNSFYVLSIYPQSISDLRNRHWEYLIQAGSQVLCSQYSQMTKSQIYFNLSLTWSLVSYQLSKVGVNIFLISALWVPAECEVNQSKCSFFRWGNQDLERGSGSYKIRYRARLKLCLDPQLLTLSFVAKNLKPNSWLIHSRNASNLDEKQGGLGRKSKTSPKRGKISFIIDSFYV